MASTVGTIEIKAKILEVATNRGPDKSTCPSEIARMLFAQNWRNHMKDIFKVAVDLQHQQKVMITQQGLRIDVDQIKGPIRIKIV